MRKEIDSLEASAVLPSACARALASSRFLQRALLARAGAGADAHAPQSDVALSDDARNWLFGLAQTPWDAARIEERFGHHLGALAQAPTVSAQAGQTAPERALRRTRRELLCALVVRDCAGLAPLEEVTQAMTALAELAVRVSLQLFAPQLAAQVGTPVDAQGRALDLLVLAMGKAGAGELNVSSDLDLIFVHRDVAGFTGGTRSPGEPIEGQQFFERLGRRLIVALEEHTAEGFVFRVDMRLRPHGDSGPLAVSMGMLEEYLVREGREWERFAWSKARVISSPVLAAPQVFAQEVAALGALVEPFVYRKYFDFGAIGAIRALHAKIRAQAHRRAAGRAHREWDVKLGRGGIREIEFVAQTFAIMRGGRDHRLRVNGTVPLLERLGQLGLMAAEEASRLIGHYRFLRRLEHALQYRDDAQTHLFPADADARQQVADLLGMDSGDDVLRHYHHVREDVVRAFDAVFPAEPGTGTESVEADAGAIESRALALCGFADPQAGAQRLRDLLASPRVAALPAGARQSVEQLAACAVRLIGRIERERAAQIGAADAAGADALLLRWIRLVETIGRRTTYLSLLAEFPVAHERVLRLLASGGWATQYLLLHPIVLDELIDPRVQPIDDLRAAALAPAQPGAVEPFWQPWVAQIDAQLRAAGADIERQMSLLRDAHHAQVFRLLLADLGAVLTLEALADHLSALADAVLTLTLRAAWRTMGAAQTQAPALAIIAYGKLGGRELGYASDLDLIFVYDAGADPLAADSNAALATQLVRRVIAWLTTVTPSGRLFEIDLRLRPNGNAGLLVTPIEAFERYQSNADGHGAWVWEHQALTRARACAGDAALGQRVEAIRTRVLRQARNPATLAEEVTAMRQRMLDGHRNHSALFDIKHDRGGMVDIEFIVQYLVLAHAQVHEALVVNRGNIGLLALASELHLVDAVAAAGAASAYRRYRGLQHALRLEGAERARVERAIVQAEIDAVLGLWRTVFGSDGPQAAARPPRPR